MINDVIAFISYLAPITAAAVGIVYTLGNRHKSIAKSFFILSLSAVAYKSLFDFALAFNIQFVIIPSYVLGNMLIFSCAPLLYLFFKSLLHPNFKINFENLRHLIFPLTMFFTGACFALFMPAGTLIDFLNARFDGNITTFTPRAFRIFYSVGFPLLVAQWGLYIYFLRKIVLKRREIYRKYYGSLEKRNQQLIKRISLCYLSIFALSFLSFALNVQNSLIIFMINSVFCILIIFSVLAGNEQLNMKKYRMYKLSSHEEEITQKNQKKPSKVRASSHAR